MSDSSTPSRRPLLDWFKNLVRPIFQKTEPAPALEELDKLAAKVEELDITKTELFPICLLGQAGVGKSTLVNTLIADNAIVVPSGGGTGPLTANALRVIYGERPSFVVRYHSRQQINKTRAAIEFEIYRKTKGDATPPAIDEEDTDEMQDMSLDDEKQGTTRMQEAIGRAKLLIAGVQSAERDLRYLADALRSVASQKPKFGSQILPEDVERIHQIQDALQHATRETARRFDSDQNPEFRRHLRDHACGFLAPLIMELSIHWPSPMLKNSLELVDLPGIGILNDTYASVTSDYLRNKAKAVMLVADSRGIRIDDARLLRDSGFLNRLLHSSNDLTADPVALIVVAVKIDYVAEENWRNDRELNGVALKTKAQHFADQVQRCRDDITERLKEYLREVWKTEDGEISAGKESVIQAILSQLKVYPVSAPQYRLLIDPEDGRPFLPDVEATNIPALREVINGVAQACLQEQARRAEDLEKRFFGQLRARLAVLSAQQNEVSKAEIATAEFKQKLEAFLAPLQREFDNRRGAFRSFLRKTIPTQIQDKIQVAAATAQMAINRYLWNHIRDAHWKTLQAAVRREGTFHGSRHINLPHDFSLRFEEPVAEVWSRGILADVRKETREFAAYQSEAVKKVLDWARQQGFRISTKLLEALVEAVDQHRQQVNAVGKEAVDELRNQVREELIREVTANIRRKCDEFVKSKQDSGAGVKWRIVDLFEELAGDVVQAATAPATKLLVDRFRQVEKEIIAAFGEHSEPLSEAAEALIKKQERRAGQITQQEEELRRQIEAAINQMPGSALVAPIAA